MAASLQPRDLFPEFDRIATVPPIGDEQYHRTAMQNPAAPALMELSNRLTDACAAGPVGHRSRHGEQRVVRSSEAQLPGDSCEPGGEQERLNPLVTARHCVCELQKHARITFHRAADVAEEYERARLDPARTPRQPHDIAASAQAFGDRASKIHARTFAANPSPSPAFAGSPGQVRQRPTRL